MLFLANPRNSIVAVTILVILYAGSIAVTGYAYLLLILSSIAIWGIMGLSWNVLGGYVGLVSFGQAAYFGLGAFAVVILAHDYGITPWIGLPVSGLIGGLSALVIGAITLRLREFYFALASLCFPLAILYLVEWAGYVELSIPIHRSAPWTFMQFENPKILPLLAMAMFAMALSFSLAIERSRFGLKLVAIRQDETAAKTAGIKVFPTKLWAAAVSGIMAGFSGGLYALVILVVTPDSVFGMLISAQAIIIAMFGGRGTAWGAVIGAVFLVPLSELLNAYLGSQLPGIAGVVYGVAIIVVVLSFPQGLFWSLSDWAKARRAHRGTAILPGRAAGSLPRKLEVASPIPASARSEGDSILGVKNVSVHFGGIRALQDITLNVDRGEFLGIIGPNGAGKTTLFNVLSGLQRPTSGAVMFNGADITGKLPNDICALGVGRTFQTVRAFPRLSLLENVVVGAFWRFDRDVDALDQAWKVLDQVGLGDRAGALASELNNRELRLMELARALAGRPRMLLLDECLAGLSAEDVDHMIATLQDLKGIDLTIVIIEHTIDAVAKLVDRMVVLNYGSVICAGPPDSVLRNEDVITAYLGKRWAAHAKN